MSTKFCNYNLILYILRLIYHRFIGQKLSKARHSLDELLNLKIHFFSKINSGFPADSTYLQLFYNSATQLPWVHLFGGEFPCQNEIPLLSLVNKSSYFLMIKIYENTIGGGLSELQKPKNDGHWVCLKCHDCGVFGASLVAQQ